MRAIRTEVGAAGTSHRRSVALLVVCVVLAAGLLVGPVRSVLEDLRSQGRATEFGVSLAAAGCDGPSRLPVTRKYGHVPTGTRVDYRQTPPASGDHWDTPAPFTKRFYSAADRPAVETLVHNLEHGYTLAWYRADAPADQVADLEDIANTFTSSDVVRPDKFIAAPWSSADGAGFPEDAVVVLAHWSADPSDSGNPAKQAGVEQSCARVSGAAVQRFMAAYPATASPEPAGP